jgi:hypothetical protein
MKRKKQYHKLLFMGSFWAREFFGSHGVSFGGSGERGAEPGNQSGKRL